MADSPNSKPDPSKRWSRRYYLLLWILIALFFVGVGVWRYKSLPPAPRWRAMLRNEFVIHIDDKRDRIITAQEGRGIHLRNVLTGEIEDTAFHGRTVQLFSDNQIVGDSFLMCRFQDKEPSLGILDLASLEERIIPFKWRDGSFAAYQTATTWLIAESALHLDEWSRRITGIDIATGKTTFEKDVFGGFLEIGNDRTEFICVDEFNRGHLVITKRDARTGRIIAMSTPLRGDALKFQLTPDRTQAFVSTAAGDGSQRLTVWDMKDNRADLRLQKFVPQRVTDFVLAPDGKTLVIGEKSANNKLNIAVIDISSANKRYGLELPEDSCFPHVTADSKLLAFADDKGNRLVVSLKTGHKYLRTKTQNATFVEPVCSADSRYVIWSDKWRVVSQGQTDGLIECWQKSTGKIWSVTMPIQYFIFLSDRHKTARSLLVYSKIRQPSPWPQWLTEWVPLNSVEREEWRVTLLDLRSGRETGKLTFDDVTLVHFSEKHQLLLAESFDPDGVHVITSWDIPFGHPNWFKVLWLPVAGWLGTMLVFMLWRRYRRWRRQRAAPAG